MEKTPLWKIIVTYWLICLWLSCLWLSPANASALTKSELETTLQTFHGNNLLTKPIPSWLINQHGVQRLPYKIITSTEVGTNQNTRKECLDLGGTLYSPEPNDNLALLFSDNPEETYYINTIIDNRTGKPVHHLTLQILPLTLTSGQVISWDGRKPNSGETGAGGETHKIGGPG